MHNSTSTHHSTSTGHGNMQSSPGAASAPLGLQFIDTMIANHEGAVEMAMLGDTRAKHPELAHLPANIVNDQEREIAKMRQWRDR
jgi:uncharacterized protein (DUF305 family)